MEFAKQRVRAAVARKKKEKKAKEIEGGTASAPKTITKVLKRKPNGKHDRPSKRAAITPGMSLRRGSHPLSQAMVRARG